MKVILVIAALLGFATGVSAQLLTQSTTNASPGLSFYAPSLAETQRVARILRPEFRTLLFASKPVPRGSSIGFPELHRPPWEEPRRDLDLPNMRFQPMTPESTK